MHSLITIKNSDPSFIHNIEQKFKLQLMACLHFILSPPLEAAPSNHSSTEIFISGFQCLVKPIILEKVTSNSITHTSGDF